MENGREREREAQENEEKPCSLFHFVGTFILSQLWLNIRKLQNPKVISDALSAESGNNKNLSFLVLFVHFAGKKRNILFSVSFSHDSVLERAGSFSAIAIMMNISVFPSPFLSSLNLFYPNDAISFLTQFHTRELEAENTAYSPNSPSESLYKEHHFLTLRCLFSHWNQTEVHEVHKDMRV